MSAERKPGQTFFEATCTFSDVVGFDMNESGLRELFIQLFEERLDACVRDMQIKIISKDEWNALPENNKE